MTVKEFYNMSKEKHFENYEIEIQYSDSGGYYYGTRDLDFNDIEIDRNSNVIVI